MAFSPSAAVTEEIRARMARKRITQAAAAAHLRISTSAMSRRMLGESEFTVGDLYRLADLFGISAAELLAPVSTSEADA